MDIIDLNIQSLIGDAKLLLVCSKGKIQLPVPGKIIQGIENTMANVSVEKLKTAYNKWKSAVEPIFKGTKKRWELNADKLKKEMNALFIEEASFIYTDYLSKMISEPSSEILALTNKYINEDVPTDFEEIWKNNSRRLESFF